MKNCCPSYGRLGKAVLVITHDDRYFGVADRLIRMDSGRIVADQRKSHAGPVVVGAAR